METTVCNRCPIRCGLTGTVAHTCIPKDSTVAIPGKPPAGVEMADIRQYCKEHYYVEEPES